MTESTRSLIGPSGLMESVACYYCGSDSFEDLVFAQDDYTGRPGTFRFVRCVDCGLAYQTPRVRLDHVRDYYDDQYISHRKVDDWGWLTWFYRYGMDKHDRRKDRIVSRYVELTDDRRVLDVGCAAGTFLDRLRRKYGVHTSGVDFKQLGHLPWLRDTEFHCGLFYEQDLPEDSFDLITMWHFLEHDYDPPRTLDTARGLLTDRGRLVIEVPRLDSLTFRMFRERWPGLQAPQHTVLFTKETLLRFVRRAGFEVVDYLPYGAFPAYFYLFAGVAFKMLKGRGLNLRRAIYPYFAGNVLLWPLLLLERRLNLAMQTVVCRRPES